MAIFRDEVMAQRVGYANFAEFCADDLKRSGYDGTTKNPNANPDFSYSRKERLERLLSLDWYYGGWMEDRSIVWSDTYLKETGNFLHLGIDCSVKAGTEVLAVRDGIIVWTGSDSPLEGGWGGHAVQLIDFQGERCALIYAHLKKAGLPPLGYLRKGATVGFVGAKHENGYWGEHLHVQLARSVEDVTDWNAFLQNDFDGYGKVAELGYWARRCPDPTPLLF